MLYYIFELLAQSNFPGARLMSYITFRSGAAFVLSLIIALIIGRRIIDMLQKRQVGEIIRNLDLEGQMSKKGTPTMGGIIIIISILLPCILVGDLSNVYMLLMITATIWMGIIGFLDDYLKTARKNKDGLNGRFKIVGQVGLGLIVGLTMYFSPDIVIRENVEVRSADSNEVVEVIYESEDIK
ncbi:MAG: phospho-N-acetylmuramoyl-pentapeptide-transferase, partial [Muribaculaceae bacterium]|nr:phospho-N-acetylmuramoyl-pentapeptide-transferase [Muribaculaceae bacterium]